MSESEQKPSASDAPVESSTVESVRGAADQAVESVMGAADQAANAVNDAISVTARGVVQAASAAQGFAACSMTQAQGVVDKAKAHSQYGLDRYQEYEDAAFGALREGIEWGIENPYVAYPVAGTAALLLLPVTRGLLWRMTLGRWRTPDSVVRNAESKLLALRPRVEDFTKQATKLQERLANAEQEYVHGLAKLRSTRGELQRLTSVVHKTERTAASTLQELRGLRKLETSVPLRAEAAAMLAALKTQRTSLERSVQRIVALDI